MDKKTKVPIKSKEAKPLMEEYRNDYGKWRELNRKNKEGFFIIYNSFVKNKILRDISGNALKIYLYLCAHSKNETGESWHSIETIAEYFDKSPRSIRRLLKELEDMNLIIRIQEGFKRKANTFLKPY